MTATAGIVLAGGRSSRMGTAKAGLEWHGSTLLRRVAGIVGRAAGPVVVVRAPGQKLPELPGDVRVVEDARKGRGPLQGLLAGLEALDPAVEVAFVSSVDVPLLHPRFVSCVLARVGPGDDAAVPQSGGRNHPLAGAYRTALRPELARLVEEDRLSLAALLERCRVRWLDDAALLADARLAEADPGLESLRNLNDPADYAAARALPPHEVWLSRDGTVRSLRAATLGAVAADLRELTAAVNGEGVGPDPELPLAAGDAVELVSRG